MGNLSLDIGLNALLTAQSGLDVTGHNLANAATPGYSRQTLLTSTLPGVKLRGLLLGRGVQADVVQRTVDTLLQGRLMRQTSSLGRVEARLGGLSEAESYLGSTGGTGVPARLSGFFASLSSLTTSPGDPLLRGGAVQSAAQLSGELNQLAGHLRGLRQDTATEMKATLDRVNQLALTIGDLNKRIPASEAGVTSANDLRDQRDEAIRQLSELVDVKVVEEPQGAVRVMVNGHMLVSPSRVEQLALEHDPLTQQPFLRLGKKGPAIAITGGRLAGLVDLVQKHLPDLAAELDEFAAGLALATGRVHSTGMPASGPFTFLKGANPVVDVDGNGVLGNELLTNAGLPFDVTSGTLYVNVTDAASGALEKHAVTIDAKRTTISDFLGALDAIDGISAKLDAQGRVQIVAGAGKGFDFSPRLDPDPDALGAFGGGQASLATDAGPFALADGDTLSLVGPAGPFTITLAAPDFQQIGQATAEELAAAINADPATQTNGLVAQTVAGRLVLQSAGSGSGEIFTVAGGSALAALGWTPGTVVSGHDTAVAVQASGVYTGAQNGRWTFHPTSDGTIGTTPGLTVEVRDASGSLLATLDVGAGYSAGDPLALPDGVSVSFGPGELSATHGDVFALDVVADADETDVLVALGLNTLFTGADAESLTVRADLLADPERLAVGLTPAAGDVGNALALLALDTEPVDAFGGRSVSERFAELAAGLGLEIDAAESTRQAEESLLAGLQARRDELSGVNVDEELVRMIEQEQAYAAASQYLRVVSDLQNELLSIL